MSVEWAILTLVLMYIGNELDKALARHNKRKVREYMQRGGK